MNDLIVRDDAAPVQITSQDMLIHAWLAKYPAHTARAYQADAKRFLAFLCQREIDVRGATVPDVQAFVAGVDGAQATRARVVSSVKSLLTFAHEFGYIRFNPAVAVRVPQVKNTLAERIMTEGDTLAMIRAKSGNPRDFALLSVLYYGGLRISEVAGLCWRDVKVRGDGAQLTVHGKGEKTRHVLLLPAIWARLQAIKPVDVAPDSAVFVSREGGHLDPASVHRVVKAAAKAAGLPEEVSAHWLRHCCASHSLTRGAAVHVVQQTLGHASLTTTTRYVHAMPNDAAGLHLPV